ncbi:hypothetical protein ACS0X5_03795 [Burkholderia gladioli]|uniref:hypothetical protein n=1 Tax=Burkholderia gladioli TaxID=28095 RepID=UPI003F79B645
MNAADDINEIDWTASDRRIERREHRIAKIADRLLPKWVPNALLREVRRNLFSTSLCRRGAREISGNPHPECSNPYCPHCQPDAHYLNAMNVERARLIRLATYPDMRLAWESIAKSERKGQFSRLPGAHSIDADGICSMLIIEINRAVNTFEHLPRRTVAQRKKGAARIAKMARELAAAIDSDEDGRPLANRFLDGYIGARHLAHRIELGETPPAWIAFCPELSYQPPPGYFESGDDSIPRWGEWPDTEKFRWLSDEIQATSMQSLLSSFAESMTDIAESTPLIYRPGSGNPNARFLAAKLSNFMQGWFGSPLDDAVACFVSAVLDLPEPLSRDDIRPRRKRATGT